MRLGLRSLPRGILAAILLAVSSRAAAQTAGGLRGWVTDQGGAPLAGATVSVRCDGLGVAGHGSTTDASGAFLVASLPPAADCAVTVSLPGFATTTLHEISVVPGRTITLRVVLQPQSRLRERVEVRARPQIVDLEDTTTETRLDSEFIETLPILGRDYQDVLTLAPGVSDIDGDGNPNIHGARDTDVVTLVDGVSTSDPLTGKIGAQLNIESIQEIEIKTSGATAQYGRAQGGFVNVVTKSGGNEFHSTFKLFWRGWLLDRDGAGSDDPRLHAGIGDSAIRDLRFNDLLPFLSFEGPIVKDHAWFFLASEYVQIQDPVNVLNSAFVAGTREFREFCKLTWQAAGNHRLALSINYDPQEYLNQGLTSFTRAESGYTDRQGGIIVTAKGTSILSPNVSLETSVSAFDERPARVPTLDPDTNGNGVLAIDFNHDGVLEVSERDPGEDYDQDGRFDIWEGYQDFDGDGRNTPAGACEGVDREDKDCDGILDATKEDLNGNGLWDPGEVDVDGDHVPEMGTEDRNHNRRLDDAPRPGGLYPYGRLTPISGDRDYTLDQKTGLVTGPFYQDVSDHRRRFTLRQDLSVYVPEARGNHDLKIGVVAEREDFDRHIDSRALRSVFVVPKRGGGGNPGEFERPADSTVRVLTTADPTSDDAASGITTGMYVQDVYRPRANISLGLGLRFDREMIDTTGYSMFDPAPERALFDRESALAGQDLSRPSLLFDQDGLTNLGIRGDPLFLGPDGLVSSSLAAMRRQVQLAALSHLTRPHDRVSFTSEGLLSVLPDSSIGEVDPTALAQLGIFLQGSERFRLTNNNLSPRLSLSWDPWADGRTKVFASWGRYYDKLFLSTVVGEQGPDTVSRYYLLDEAGFHGVPDSGLGKVVSKSPASITQVDRGLRTPFDDELTLGFDREIAPELAVSLTFIDRRFRDQLQDIDVNHFLLEDPETGRLMDRIGHLEFLPGSTGQAVVSTQMPDGRPDLYIDNFFFNQVLRIGNFNEARYKGIELALRRRLSRRWEMQGSYTYSRAVGAAEDFQSLLGNDSSTQEWEFGYLDYDQRHVIKLNAAIYLPRDWQMGVASSWSSGLPYSIITRFFALDDADYIQYRTRYGFSAPDQGRLQFVGERRNSQRNDPVLDINMSLRKSFVVGRKAGSLFIEVFNLLNKDDLRIYSYQPGEFDRSNRDDPTPLSRLQIDGVRRFGRRFQLGIQFEF